MRLSSLLIPSLTFAGAAGLSLVVAGFAATAVEDNTEIVVRRTLDQGGFSWAEVVADGLRVELSGEAPTEARRFAAISSIGAVVDASRIIDQMEVTPSEGIAPPRFSTEILRNDAGISIIGLIPTASDHAELLNTLGKIKGRPPIADFVETADYPLPPDWADSMAYALKALALLPRTKISVEAGQVRITAIADSPQAKTKLEAELNRMAPPTVHVALDIAAPRPVISPFTLRYVLTPDGGRFDACSAESTESRDRILQAAQAAGLRVKGDCTIGLGVPSANWSRAVEVGLSALAELGQGSITYSNGDVTLVADEGTNPTLFDRVVGELENALPQVFVLHAVLPEPETQASDSAPEFSATLSPEGQVQLRGRLSDDAQRRTVDSYARARFGSDAVYLATRNVPDLPGVWPIRVLAALDALAQLERGAVTVTPDLVTVRGMSHIENASAEVARMLSDKLGEAEEYELDLVYEAPPEPEDQLMAPALCEAELAAIQRADKIAFEPGSATVAADSARVIDKIAKLLGQCGEIPLEVQGHTDSQGREEMNQNLSQARAQSVLNALRARRLLTGSFIARGYGETNPIASNETEEGREANRRIEFRLIVSEADMAGDDEAEGAAPAETPSDAGDADIDQSTGESADESDGDAAPLHDDFDDETTETPEETDGQ
ncbi:OmpA family protein [Tritonibacter horizontis]|uniref:Putative lipoprotein YiaD n=1 Tax=Tritonibacter horizontis TaxID=1768241 RepID=A0A132BTI9_9RHOB|nr:OmpA family protein [Tritonibacter horizontis]KUP91673.1 putative lipoprotein YiaD precursor [Tritonibacter horizontis]